MNLDPAADCTSVGGADAHPLPMSPRSATTHRTGPDQLALFDRPDDKPAEPVRQPNERSEAGAANATPAGRVVSRDTGSPQGWERCPGGYGIAVSSEHQRRKWWRCPSCGWVGFQINTLEPPEVPGHHRPKEGGTSVPRRDVSKQRF